MVIRVEEMDDKCKMSPGRQKDFIDVGAVKGEKKGSIIRPIRPLLIFFTSNQSSEVIYKEDWDDAMRSRFSLERWTGRVDDDHTWSQDLIIKIDNIDDLQIPYNKLRSIFHTDLDIPTTIE